MKRLIVLVTGIALVWAGFWVWQMWTLRSAVDTWAQERRAAGWQVSYDAVRVRGFPNRLDLTLDGVAIFDPSTDLGWNAPFLQVLGLTYRPGHKIIVWPDIHSIKRGDDLYEMSSKGLRASLVQDADGQLLRFNLEAETLHVAAPGQKMGMGNVLLGFQASDMSKRDYLLGLQILPAGAVTSDTGQGSTDGLRAQAVITFDRLWKTSGLSSVRPQPEKIDLRQVNYRAQGQGLDVAGRLDIDGTGLADGDLTLKVREWRDLLDTVTSAGLISAAMAKDIQEGLETPAAISSQADLLDLILRFDAGRMIVGVVPLGDGPQLRLP